MLALHLPWVDVADVAVGARSQIEVQGLDGRPVFDLGLLVDAAAGDVQVVGDPVALVLEADGDRPRRRPERCLVERDAGGSEPARFAVAQPSQRALDQPGDLGCRRAVPATLEVGPDLACVGVVELFVDPRVDGLGDAAVVTTLTRVERAVPSWSFRWNGVPGERVPEA